MKKVMVVIDEGLHRDYKIKAAEVGISMRDLMASALAKYFEDPFRIKGVRNEKEV